MVVLFTTPGIDVVTGTAGVEIVVVVVVVALVKVGAVLSASNSSRAGKRKLRAIIFMTVGKFTAEELVV